MAARKASSSLWRGIIVALGCISAVWLIFYNCELVASYIKSFISNQWDFIDYFFNQRLSAFAALFLGVSFFAIIIRDLWALKKPLLWITLLFSALCLLSVLINLIISPINLSGNQSYMLLFEKIIIMLLMIAYIAFSIVGINSKRYQPFTFYYGVFSFLLILAYHAIEIFENNQSPDLNAFIPYLTIFFANFFVFKCSLYEK